LPFARALDVPSGIQRSGLRAVRLVMEDSGTAGDVLPCAYGVTQDGNTMSEATFSFRVDEALKNEFAAAAKARDRTGAQLLRDFMREFVLRQQEAAEHDAWFRRQVQAGLDSANAGRLVPAAEVGVKFAGRRAATRRRLEVSG